MDGRTLNNKKIRVSPSFWEKMRGKSKKVAEKFAGFKK